MKKLIFLIVLFTSAIVGCEKETMDDPVINYNVAEEPESATGKKTNPELWLPDLSIFSNDPFLFEFSDIDGNVYHAIQIGSQIWSKENLKTTHYNDGTPIPGVQGTTQWTALTSGAYCYYKNEASVIDTYGLLYNYYSVASDKLAPKGWHVATIEDWNTLMIEIGNKAFPTIGDVGVLVDQRVWPDPFYSIRDVPVVCTNSTFFTALPNGYRDNSFSPDYPEFDCLGYQASWWASNHSGKGEVIYLDGVFGIFDRDDRPATSGSGVRLVKDAE